MDRITLLLGDATKQSRIIEIGPSHAPIAPKRAGWNCFVVDHADQDALRAKYATFPVDVDAIEAVDAVWHGGRLEHTVPAARHGTFDRLIASHVIEHIPDPVTFLVSAQTLLAPDGALALAVPDKRYCFDFLKPHSTTGDLLAAHDPHGAGRHTARTQFHQLAYSAFADEAGAWGQHKITRARLVNTLPEAHSAFAHASMAPDSPYVDAHAWQFTPSAFRLAILELAEGGLIDWQVADCTPAMGTEFIATLRRGRPTWPSAEAREAARLELLLGILAEQREMIERAAEGGLLSIPVYPTDPAIARAIRELNAGLAAQQARLDAVAQILAPPTDQPASLGTLADLTARMDAMQRQLASITAADGTQASIMASLAQLATRQQHHHDALDNVARAVQSLAESVAAQQRVLEEVRRTTGGLERLMAPLRWVKARLRGGK
jgi:SAM-dependent methyltransferase